MKTNTDSSVAEPTAGSLPPAASTVAKHPLAEIGRMPQPTWIKWKRDWDKEDLSKNQRTALLHWGFDTRITIPEQHERAQLYLRLATDYRDADQFKPSRGERYFYDQGELNEKVEVATKAFQMLCTHVFKGELVTYKFMYEQDWPWSWLFDDLTTVEYLIRFLIAEGTRANKEEHPYEILNKFIRAIGTILFESSDTVTYICTDDVDKARRLNHVEMMRPRLLPVFLDRGNEMYLCDKGVKVMLENPGCMKVIREYIFAKKYFLPKLGYVLGEDSDLRKATSLQEAVVGGSMAAIAYGVLLMKKKYTLKLVRRRKAQRDLEDAQRRLAQA